MGERLVEVLMGTDCRRSKRLQEEAINLQIQRLILRVFIYRKKYLFPVTAGCVSFSH